jgi:anaerobic dimethyl sulfoxide reductase subunit A
MKDVPWEKWNDEMEKVCQEAYETWRKRSEIAALNPPTWEEFKKKPHFRFPLIVPIYLEKALKTGFPTQAAWPGRRSKIPMSGKIEFWSEFFSDPVRARRESWEQLTPMAMYEVTKDDFWSPDTKKFPLVGQVGIASQYATFTCHEDNSLLKDEYRNALWISLADAKARGIKDGDLVRVYNDVGETLMPAYVTPRQLPGAVGMKYLGQYHPSQMKTSLSPDGIDRGGSCNLLTHDHYVRGFCTLEKALVQVEKF